MQINLEYFRIFQHIKTVIREMWSLEYEIAEIQVKFV